jgi:calcineurin-like phosphoesterase family protein
MDLIIKNWCKIVKSEDVVMHLGDVQVGWKSYLPGLLASLPGTKLLVRGNHDGHSNMWYMRNGFAASCDGMMYGGATLTHRPSDSLYGGTDINIHGHVHNSAWTPTKPFQRLLALEYVGYRPVDFQKFCGLARSPEKWKKFVASWEPRPRIDQKSKNAKDVRLHGPDLMIERQMDENIKDVVCNDLCGDDAGPGHEAEVGAVTSN